MSGTKKRLNGCITISDYFPVFSAEELAGKDFFEVGQKWIEDFYAEYEDQPAPKYNVLHLREHCYIENGINMEQVLAARKKIENQKKRSNEMEEKIKRLKAHLAKLYPTLSSGEKGYWAVGESEVWPVETAADAGDAPTFKVKKLSGVWVITPATVTDRKTMVSFRLPVETIEKLKQLSKIEGKSQAVIVEDLIDASHLEKTN